MTEKIIAVATGSATQRRRVADVARRLSALLEEGVAPASAVSILVAQANLPAQAAAEPACPLASAVRSCLGSGPRKSALDTVADHVRDCEAQGRGAAALRLLGKQRVARTPGRIPMGVIAIELVVLLLVLEMHAIFVLPQFRTMYEAAGAQLPQFTQWVLGIANPRGPFDWIVLGIVLTLLLWAAAPRMFGMLLAPLDRAVLSLPLIGPALRTANGDRLAGWLGCAAPDAASQRGALAAAETWYRGTLFARVCAETLRATQSGADVAGTLASARGFDAEFRADVALPERADALAALRARWRGAGDLPESRSAVAAALAQVALGVLVASITVALYLPIFRLAALM